MEIQEPIFGDRAAHVDVVERQIPQFVVPLVKTHTHYVVVAGTHGTLVTFGLIFDESYSVVSRFYISMSRVTRR